MLNEERIQGGRLSDERVSNLVAAVGNAESKALTLIAMSDRRTYTSSGLDARMLEIQGATKGWIMGKALPYSYCKITFAPIGLVATEVTDSGNNQFGYVATDTGMNEGLVLAGLLTQLSEKHEGMSLYHLFGRTNSPSEIVETSDETGEYRRRASLARIRMFRQLVTHSDLPIRSTDLTKAVGENLEHTKSHLTQLRRFGVVSYKSFDQEGAYTSYSLPDETPMGEPIPFQKYRALTDFTYSFVTEHPNSEVTAEAVIAGYIAVNPKAKELSTRYLQNNISGALLSLSRQGFLLKKGHTKDSRSEISLTQKQRALLEEVVDVVERFQDKDPQTWYEGKTYATELISNPTRVAALLKKAHDLLPQVSQMDRSELAAYVYSVIEGHPNSSVPEIQRFLADEYDIDLSRTSIAQAVRSSSRNQALVKVLIGRSHRYSIPRSDEASE